MKPKVLLLWPPVYDFALFDLFLKPFGLLRLGKWFDDSGYDVNLINCLDYTESRSLAHFGVPIRQKNGTGKFFRQVAERPAVFGPVKRHFARYGILHEVMEKRIRQCRPDIVLVGSGMTYWYPGVIEAIDCVKKNLPNVPVVLGGVYSILCRAHAQNNCGADYVVAGDGFTGLAPVLEKCGLPVPGAGKAYAGPPESQLIVRDGFLDAAGIRLHSGCPMKCSYCASVAVSGAFLPGDPEALFNEVCVIHRKLGITNFAFYDDALLYDADRGIIPFLNAIADSGLKLDFYTPNGMHISLLTPQIAMLMRKTGFRDLRFGVESTRNEFHSVHDNKFTHEMLPDALSMLHEAGFANHEITAYLLAGLPGQYAEEAEEAIMAVHASGAHAYVSEYSPIPGSALWQQSVKLSRFPIAEDPLCHNNTLFAMQWEGFTIEDLERLKGKARDLNRRLEKYK
ncbi:MAG: radical SAM protein [Spirochaetaceae bacterium]|nr:MAG: radical SAM protein [Spirochaetaceae bacterium]